MTNFTIYQQHLSNAASDKLNSVGWDGNFGEFKDAILCHRDVKFRGSEEFKPHYFNLYSKVAKVEAEDLDDVFFIGNTGRPMERLSERMHSISIGDIIESEGSFFMVDGYGFTQVEVA